MKKLLFVLLGIGCLVGGWALPAMAATGASTAVAFHYGANPPWDELQAFDLVVVDPDHVKDPGAPALPNTRLAAYVSVGEVHPSRAYAAQIPADWLRGDNRDWGSRLIDQSNPAWPVFFAEKILAPLWNAGYRAFFFDTLDSYQLFAKTPTERAAQEAGMVALVHEVKRRYPQAELMFNRGFEILERTHQHVSWVAAESLLQGYVAASQSYRPVPLADREWLLAQFKRIQNEYHLPVIVIDYVPLGERALARATARDIAAMGFTPWVATPDLTTVGVGLVDPMPRRVLVLQSRQGDEYQLRDSVGVRLLTMPLNYLGYGAEFVDPSNLPDTVSPSRYAGVVVWLGEQGSAADQKKVAQWLGQRVDDHLPVVFMDDVSPMLDALSSKLGVDSPPVTPSVEPVRIVQQAPMVGFERQPRPQVNEFTSLRLRNGTPLLTLRQGQNEQVAAAIAPWGGYVMAPFGAVTLSNSVDERWVINPFLFLQQALQLPDMPVPDVTTESGRRMLLVHMDGDGFVSRSELPGNPLAGELVRDRVVKKYPVPMAISVIEAELSAQGLHPKLSAQAESVARDIFAAPHVEMASHSYSHPFYWGKAAGAKEEDGYNLRLPGYRFNLQREIEGSVRYIEERLAPPGKKVKIFLWTGDCTPGRDALEWTQRVGVANMNGGDTVATRSNPTLTQVEGLGIERGGLFQVFAPNQNENVYTNLWRGPFYGFERVLETFEFTETPRRLKPINIYFHTYLTTKAAGMRSLDKVFTYALAQETTPVFASDYARKVVDFARVSVARTASGWRVRGLEQVHTVRASKSLGVPHVGVSEAVAGFSQRGDDVYLHLTGSSAELRFAPNEVPEVRLVSANARIESVEKTTSGYRWNLIGHVPLEFTLAHAENCKVQAAGRDLVATRSADGQSHYKLTSHAARPLEATCRS
ncbi:MAG: bifunctional glycoside hydrolase 114/ polysaccharide deacetylase family protein [Burkholderiaceae bacterium]|nr:bifunctional glycoside hydrolase 114/ polysaccharide deacetylase family protein [Burkholderiaceae bacterium]